MKRFILILGIAAIAIPLSSCDFFNRFFEISQDESSSSHEIVNPGSSSLGGGSSGDGIERKGTRYTYGDVHQNAGYGYVVDTPSVGNVRLLVLPIIQSDYRLSTAEESKYMSDMEKVFFGDSEDTSWESVRSFYEKSSYGKLSFSGEVMPWYDCGLSSSEIARLNQSDGTAEGVTLVIESAIAHWEKEGILDTKDFDGDGDGYIDAIWAVYSGPNYTNDPWVTSNNWAFTYWAYENEPGNPSDPLPYAYSWASYDFMYEGYGENAVDGHTFIHETGHLLGLPDYYDYNSRFTVSPVGGVDMMDNNVIDHNSWSKFALGWTEPYVYEGGEHTLTLRPFSSSGDALILPTGDGWNGSAFDEFLMLEYYAPEGLNEKDALDGSASYVPAMQGSGIRVWHVDARLMRAEPSPNPYAQENVVTFVDDLQRVDGYSEAIIQSVAFSNTPGGSDYENFSGEATDFLQLTLIDKAGRSFGTSSLVQDNRSLFLEGDIIDVANDLGLSDQFPRGLMGAMNDGSRLARIPEVEILSITEEGATLSIRP